ncbi:MAG TPA: hypothetical protein VJW76_12235 [Verrucomicrobiae bacterium]|nr:hypothetical protein [Verrucomicrobiae bacterium]
MKTTTALQAVAQIFNLLCRRIGFCEPSPTPDAQMRFVTPPIANRRYSRLQTCATGGSAFIVAFLAAGSLVAQEAPKADSEKKSDTTPTLETEVEYRNWIELGIGGTFIDGDNAAFMRRHGIREDAFGGLEELHLEQDVGKRGLFTIDGRAIYDNHDYSVRLELSEPEKGFLRAGYTEFRTWYDGSGGFFPLGTNNWFSLYDEELAIDRREFWFEGGLRLPEVPEITLRYSHQIREGQKDSLVWGDALVTGVAAPNNTRGIVPSFWDIDEVRDLFEVDAKHTFGKTDVGLGLRYELFENDNSRNIRRRPNEASDRYLTQRDSVEGDMFNAHAFTETRFTEKLMFTTGYSYTTMDTDTSGSRIYGAGYDPIYDPLFARRQARDEGFLDLAGGSQLNQYVVNLNLMWTPLENFTVVPAVRVERQDIHSVSEFVETNVGTGAGLPSSQEELAGESERAIIDVSESLEVRYTGFTNWVLYARGNWMQGRGDLRETETLVASNVVDLLRDTDFDRSIQKYTVGANWYPLRNLNMGAQYYHKIRTEDYEHRQDTTPNRTGNRYPAFLLAHDFETDDANVRVTWRPLRNLTLVSRYDYQLSTVEMQGDGLAEIESAELTSHIFSQSISWIPSSRLFVQASVNYALDETDTPANDVVTTNGVPLNVVLNSENDYWNASATVGYVLDDKTDLQAQYFYYRADNYVNNSAASQPYGVDAEEHGIIATLSRRLTERVRWTLKYGFFNNRDRTSGGRNDYDAHLVMTSVQLRF